MILQQILFVLVDLTLALICLNCFQTLASNLSLFFILISSFYVFICNLEMILGYDFYFYMTLGQLFFVLVNL